MNGVPVSISSFSVAMKSSAESCVHHRQPRVVDQLARMHRRGDRRVGADLAELAEDAEFEIGEAAALAGAPAGARDGDAADHDEIERLHLLERDRLADGEEALRGRRRLELDALGAASSSGSRRTKGKPLVSSGTGA